MFVRFVPVTHEIEDSDYTWSAFGAISHLQEHGDDMDALRLDEIYNWFVEHLPTPWAFHKRGNGRAAICWFKSSAGTYISRMREAVSILKDNAIDIEMITSRNPGYIVYEDDYQVAAVPFRS